MREDGLLAGISTWLAHSTGQSFYDAIGTISVGALLGLTALILVQKNRQLLLGKPPAQLADVVAAFLSLILRIMHVVQSAWEGSVVRDANGPRSGQWTPCCSSDLQDTVQASCWVGTSTATVLQRACRRASDQARTLVRQLRAGCLSQHGSLCICATFLAFESLHVCTYSGMDLADWFHAWRKVLRSVHKDMTQQVITRKALPVAASCKSGAFLVTEW